MRRLPRITLPARQRGAALLILLALFATAAIYMLVSSLNKSSVTLSLARAEKNRAVMQEAKAALIAYTAAQALKDTTLIPGSLPCPDRNNDGIAESSCSASSTTARLGRLPYKTLGIGELRDASGELLWYGLSANFRNYTGKVNSDRQGTITVSGLTPATNAVAVVLAPGTALGTQDRSPGGASCNTSTQACNNAINYLEGINGDNVSANDYVAAAENLTDAVVANLFNDQLLVITQPELLAAVEPVVAARIERDIVRQFIYDPSDTSTSTQWSDTAGPNKSRYFNAWGAFPFAAPFADPGSSSFTGQAGTYEGLLPVVSNLTYTWSSVGLSQTGGSGVVWNGSTCWTAVSNTQIQCGIWYYYAPKFRMSGTANNVGRSFVQLPRLSDVSISGSSMSSRSMSGSLNNAGVGTVRLDATMSWRSDWTYATVTIKNDNLLVSALTSTTSSEIAGWFNRNEWYKQTYYAVSPGYAPGGAGSCNPSSSPYCLTVDNTTAPTNNKRAIVILAGRSLSGASRPNSTPGDYLEGKNDPTTTNISTGDYAFEHSVRASTTFSGNPVAINDRVIVVAP